MSRLFGWSLPPGCGTLPGEEDPGPCDVCCNPVDDCICAECPVCSAAGDATCYVSDAIGGHNMLLTTDQIIARNEAAVWAMAEALGEEQRTLRHLKEHPELLERGRETIAMLDKQAPNWRKTFTKAHLKRNKCKPGKNKVITP